MEATWYAMEHVCTGVHGTRFAFFRSMDANKKQEEKHMDPHCKNNHPMVLCGVVVLEDESVTWIDDPECQEQVKEEWMSHQVWFCKECKETQMLVTHPSDW